MKSEIYRCDVCRTEKKESNHWYRGLRIAGGYVTYTWGALAPDEARAEHLCGLPCAMKAMCAAMEVKSDTEYDAFGTVRPMRSGE